MSKEDVQDQQPQEELTDEQADAEFDKRLRGDEEGDESESGDAEPEGEKADSQGDEEAPETPEEGLDDLKKERDALKKELSRVRSGKRDESDRVATLESELKEIREKISKGDSKRPLDNWDLATTKSQLAMWEDKADELRETGDAEELTKVKAYVRAIRDALPDKMVQEIQGKGAATEAEKNLEKSVTSITDMVLEKFPDVTDDKSELYELADTEMSQPEFAPLNQALGQTIASQLAMLRLILKNPDLLKGKAKPEKVLKNVNKELTKASMNAGAKNDTTAPVNLSNLSDEEQDKIMEELLRGSRTSI